MKYILSLLLAVLVMAPVAAEAKRIEDLEKQVRVTERFENKQIIAAIEAIMPYVAPDGTLYDEDRVNDWRYQIYKAAKRHCEFDLEFQDKNVAVCDLMYDPR